MQFGFAFKSIFRTPVKTLLFVLLLISITITLCLGFNVWLSANHSLDAADEAFKTIGVIEPDWFYDNFLDYSPIVPSKYVQSFDHRAVVPGFSDRLDTEFIRSSAYGRHIIEFTPIEVSDGKPMQCEVIKVHYSRTSMSPVKGDIISINPPDLSVLPDNVSIGPSLTIGRTYLAELSGLIDGTYSVDWDWSTLFSALNEIAGLLEIEDFGLIMEVNNDNRQEGLIWEHYIQQLNNVAHTATVYATNDLDTILTFHQGGTSVIQGRSFFQEDYSKGNRVCLINADLASINRLSLGDTIPLSFSEGSLKRSDSILVGHWFQHLDVIDAGSYEIVGIYQVRGNLGTGYGIRADTIFIPQKSLNYQPYRITWSPFVLPMARWKLSWRRWSNIACLELTSSSMTRVTARSVGP